MSNSLLPPSASGFMRNVATGASRLSRLPVDLNTLWNADKCPLELLPYLAWALSVDRWDKRWSEQTKRQVIKAAWLVHRQKGTIAAIRRAIEPFGYLVRVAEWFQYGGEPGTFQIDVGVNEQGITNEVYWEIERLIDQTRPCSRHLTALSINLDVNGVISAAAVGYLGDELTVYPYMPEVISATGHSAAGAGIHIIDNMSVTA
ncbi:phage tail protein I [Brenneria rubrifaciens]|uniref:Phage tail protein I n=1 Tax=Brenneria rubrifaciens TaxID=55213 RepID=A0A4P8R0C3_9GAMM|nr:phage tail protein I [Brenneria rubrifaciens]QCR10015.1 phage tail protein I [Brenneria rubrifaciens]